MKTRQVVEPAMQVLMLTQFHISTSVPEWIDIEIIYTQWEIIG